MPIDSIWRFQGALACSLAQLGRGQEAQQAVAEMQRALADDRSLDNVLARFVDRADRERILQGLRQTGWGS
jgi:hypothetical protein